MKTFQQPRPDQVITDNNEERNEAGDILPVENPPPADHHLVDKDAEATLNAMLDKIENGMKYSRKVRDSWMRFTSTNAFACVEND